MSGKVMTVGELIEALKDIEPTLPVTLEGCDCSGDLGGVRVTVGLTGDSTVVEKVVYLERVP